MLRFFCGAMGSVGPTLGVATCADVRALSLAVTDDSYLPRMSAGFPSVSMPLVLWLAPYWEACWDIGSCSAAGGGSCGSW